VHRYSRMNKLAMGEKSWPPLGWNKFFQAQNLWAQKVEGIASRMTLRGYRPVIKYKQELEGKHISNPAEDQSKSDNRVGSTARTNRVMRYAISVMRSIRHLRLNMNRPTIRPDFVGTVPV